MKNNQVKNLIWRLIFWLIFVLLIINLIFLQKNFDSAKFNRKLTSVGVNVLIAPNTFESQSLKQLDFGFHQILADILWLQTIQYFGGGNFQQKYSALPKLLQTIIELDPQFIQPIEFGLIVLPYQGDASSAVL